MIVETGFLALIVAAAHKAWKGAKALTPEEEIIYLECLANTSGPRAPEIFRKMATWMSARGHRVQAKILRSRAEYLEEDSQPEIKAQRRAIISKAMKSTNVEAILNIASWFESKTATGIARDLRAHAADVAEGRFNPETQEKSNGHSTVIASPEPILQETSLSS